MTGSAPRRPPTSPTSRSAARLLGLIAAGACLLFGSCGGAGPVAERQPEATPSTTESETDAVTPLGLGERDIDLRDGPVLEPVTLRIPAIDLDRQILGVGMTPGAVMDAPAGPAEAPTWQQAFWYRGSAVPGTASTALIAGHVDDPLGRPGVFARLDELRPGDQIVVHDTRNGTDARFEVTTAQSYTLDQAAEPGVLRTMYGAGPVEGRWPIRSPDGLAHLVLVTCAGTYRGATHDHRLVVRAVQVA